MQILPNTSVVTFSPLPILLIVKVLIPAAAARSFFFISEGFLLVSKSRLRHLTTAKPDVPCFALCRAKEKIG